MKCVSELINFHFSSGLYNEVNTQTEQTISYRFEEYYCNISSLGRQVTGDLSYEMV